VQIEESGRELGAVEQGLEEEVCCLVGDNHCLGEANRQMAADLDSEVAHLDSLCRQNRQLAQLLDTWNCD
jgi:hypothetical protein